VTLDAVDGLTVSPEGNEQIVDGAVTVAAGADFSFTVTPDQDSGWSGAEVWLSGDEAVRLMPVDGVYTMRNVVDDAQVIITGAVELTDPETADGDFTAALLNKNVGLIMINCAVNFGEAESMMELNPQRRIVVAGGELNIFERSGLLIAEGAELEITSDGIVRVSGAEDWSVCGLMTGGTVYADGSLIIESSGYVENHGTVVLGESGCIDADGGLLKNYGTVTGIGSVINSGTLVNEGEISETCSLQNGGAIIAAALPDMVEDSGVVVIGENIMPQVGFERGDEMCFIYFEIDPNFRPGDDFAISFNGAAITRSESGEYEENTYMLDGNYCSVAAVVGVNDEHMVMTLSGIVAAG
jgi:hypothetical protein